MHPVPGRRPHQRVWWSAKTFVENLATEGRIPEESQRILREVWLSGTMRVSDGRMTLKPGRLFLSGLSCRRTGGRWSRA